MFLQIKSRIVVPSFVRDGKSVPKLVTAFVFVVWLTACPAQAAIIQVDAQATYTGTNNYVSMLIPVGTTVTASAVQFDVGPGTPQTATTSGGSGTFNWNNGGPQVYTVSGIAGPGQSASGILTYNLHGTGPTISGITPDPFIIRFNIGTNPFTTTLELSDLLLGGSVYDIRVGARTTTVGTTYDTINGDVSGTTSLVPEPSTFIIWSLLGALGISYGCSRRRKAA